MAITYKEGGLDTGLLFQPERRLEIHPKLIYIGYNNVPLLHLSMGRNEHGLPAKKASVGNPKYQIQVKDSKTPWTAINGGPYSSDITTFTVDSTDHINLQEQLQLIGNDEIVKVLSKTATSVTVLRAFGQTVAATVADNTPLLTLANARQEFSTLGTPLGVQVRPLDNYTQIIDEVIGLSGTAEMSTMVYGKKKTDLRKEGLIAIKRKIERAFLFGEPFVDLTGGPDSKPVRATGGIRYWINGVGNISTGTTVTKQIFLTWQQKLFTTQDQEWKVVLASPLWITAITFWQAAQLRFRPTDVLGGMFAAQIDTGHGTIYIIRDTYLQDAPGGNNAGYGGMLIGFEPKDIGYIYLNGRDLGLYTDQQLPGTDGKYDVYRGEVGFWISAPENGRLYEGATAYT